MNIQKYTFHIITYIMMFAFVSQLIGCATTSKLSKDRILRLENNRHITISIRKDLNDRSGIDTEMRIGYQRSLWQDCPFSEVAQDIVKNELISNGYNIGNSIYVLTPEIGVLKRKLTKRLNDYPTTVVLTLRNSNSNTIVYQQTYENNVYSADEVLSFIQESTTKFINNIPPLDAALNQEPSTQAHTVPTINPEQQQDKSGAISTGPKNTEKDSTAQLKKSPLDKLIEMKEKGIISDEEFQGQRKVLIEQVKTELAAQGYTNDNTKNNNISSSSAAQATSPEAIIDVDVNIPPTKMKNPDGVAVVIGNRNYLSNDIPEVKYALNDSRIMKEYLIKTLGFSEGNVIYMENATKIDFEEIFGIRGNHKGELYDFIKPGKSDVFIYYSGHGAPDTNTLMGYFIPSDCKSPKYELTGYSLDLFYENISKLPAKNVTVVLDACFSGGTSSGKSLIGSSSPFGIKVDNPAVAKDNTICMTSSEGDQISSWYDEKHHGLFTYFFLKSIKDAANNKEKKNDLTFEELYESLRDNTEGVPYWARRLYQGRNQTPTIQGSNLSKIFIQY